MSFLQCYVALYSYKVTLHRKRHLVKQRPRFTAVGYNTDLFALARFFLRTPTNAASESAIIEMNANTEDSSPVFGIACIGLQDWLVRSEASCETAGCGRDTGVESAEEGVTALGCSGTFWGFGVAGASIARGTKGTAVVLFCFDVGGNKEGNGDVEEESASYTAYTVVS